MKSLPASILAFHHGRSPVHRLVMLKEHIANLRVAQATEELDVKKNC
jgi:hypothetical protein